MLGTLSAGEEAQLTQTIEMFEVITQSQPLDYQSLEILKEAYLKLGRQPDVVNTSKRIAEAYVQLGQLSSAILEYETILQQYPEDPDVLAAMSQIESKANSLSSMPPPEMVAPAKSVESSQTPKTSNEVEDGEASMRQLFVNSKVITAGDFEACWPRPSLTSAPNRVIDPFIQVLAERSILPMEHAIKLLLEKTRLPYLMMERYDVDVELLRTFPKDTCQRWCVMPFDRMSKSVMVATANPFNKHAAAELKKATQNRLLWYVVSPLDLSKLLKKFFR